MSWEKEPASADIGDPYQHCLCIVGRPGRTDCNDWFIIFVMRGLLIRFDLMSTVEQGSRVQVEGLIF